MLRTASSIVIIKVFVEVKIPRAEIQVTSFDSLLLVSLSFFGHCSRPGSQGAVSSSTPTSVRSLR